MKKFFTLICALVGFVAAANAADVKDLLVSKNSYVVNFADVTNNGAGKPGKGTLFADGRMLDVTGGSVATNKGESDPSTYVSADGTIDLTTKYAKYGKIKNTFRLKNAQDVIAMSVTQGSKVIMLGQVHASRYPKIATNAALTENVQTLAVNTTSSDGYSEWTAPNDMVIYIGSEGGDWYLGYIIYQANVAPGTPEVSVGAQSYDSGEGLWYREVSIVPFYDETNEANALYTYTTDGTTPTADSELYTEPFRVYENCTVKFTAFQDIAGGIAVDGCEFTDGDGAAIVTDEIVSFSFDAPEIAADGTNVTIIPAYDGATNYYKKNDGEWIEGDSFTLDESTTVTAKSVYANDGVCEWESKTSTKDVYVLTPISETTTITVSGKAVVDEEATAADPNGNKQYKVEDGAISADKAHFFVKNLVLAAIADPQYQIDGQEAYIQMSNTTIDFELAEASAVTVICSKNSCKNIDSETQSDRACKITVDANTYGGEDILTTWELKDAEGTVVETLAGNVVKFNLEAGHHQFKKYSGTGAIKIASITIEPGKSVFTGISNVNAASAAKTVKAIENGQLVIKSAKGTFSVAGAQMK